MKKIIFFFVLFGGLILPVFAFANFDFINPISPTWFPVKVNAIWEIGDIPEPDNAVWWNYQVALDSQGFLGYTPDCFDFASADLYSDYFASSTLGAEVIFSADELIASDEQEGLICLEKYHNDIQNDVFLWFYDENYNSVGDFVDFSFTLSQESQVPYNIVPLKSDFASKILTYPKNLGSNVIDLIYLIIGLPLAFWSIGKIISLTKLG
jgi:hypothetical protein